jgi:ribosome-binding ATPase YchF (GTP1/OBG family)
MGANYRILRDICSMNNLEKLDLIYNELTLEDLAQLFRSCPKLTKLQLTSFQLNKQEKDKDEGLDEELKHQLRSGFQRLQHLHLIKCVICSDSWPIIQEILT